MVRVIDNVSHVLSARSVHGSLCAASLVLAGCQTQPPPAAPVVSASPAAAAQRDACASTSIVFRPRSDATYRVRVVERRQVYESDVTFAKSPEGWIAVEAGFSILEGSVPAHVEELAGAELRWVLDALGKPVRLETSERAPSFLESVSVFTFRRVVLSSNTIAACPGASWDADWDHRENDGRRYAYRYRVRSARDGVARLELQGRYTTPVNHWDMDGNVDIALTDGFAGESALHVRGPGAPELNDFERRISIVAPPLRE